MEKIDTRDIVTYGSPPIEEVAIAAQFNELSGFNFRALHAVYSEFKDRVARIEERGPISPQFELFDDGSPIALERRIQFSAESLPSRRRVLLIESDEARLVQIQSDRFVKNWRKRADSNEYPRFKNILPDFLADYEAFCSALVAEGYERPIANQVDVSYFNSIYFSDEHTYLDALDRYISIFSFQGPSKSTGLVPEQGIFSLKFSFFEDGPESPRGRLHVDLAPAVDAENRPSLRLQLVARGHPASAEIVDIGRFAAAGRREIVSMFDRIISEDAKTEWERETNA